jgi:hypothetical protein
MNDPNDSTSTGDGDSLSSNNSTSTDDGDSLSSNDSTSTDDGDSFLEFCVKVRNNDPSILPTLGEPFKIRPLSEKEDMEQLANALLENTSVTYLQLRTEKCTKRSAEALAKYVRTSKCLQRIIWYPTRRIDDRASQQREEMLCCFLPAIQESASLKELRLELPCGDGPSNLALENMLTHTQSLRSLSLICPAGRPEDKSVAAVSSGLKKNTTLQELTLEFPPNARTDGSPLLTSLRDHPLLRRLCVSEYGMDLAGLGTLLLSDTSKITELDIQRFGTRSMVGGLPRVLQALARRPTLTKLILRGVRLGRDEVTELGMVLCNTPSL